MVDSLRANHRVTENAENRGKHPNGRAIPSDAGGEPYGPAIRLVFSVFSVTRWLEKDHFQDPRMTALDLVRRLHQHRAWANGNLLTAAAQLSDEQLRSPFPIGQGSIWKSLLHLYAAEFVWLEALLGNEEFLVPGDLSGKLPGNQQGEGG